MEQGCVHVYTGDGKGKTTAAAGLAARAAGQGLRVVFIQFLKSGVSGEVLSLARLGVQVIAPQMKARHEAGRPKFTWEMDAGELAQCGTQQCETLARAVQMAPDYDLMVLDEVICAVQSGMIPLPALLAAVQQKPAGLELVLTGRGADAELLELADYATEMRMLKHPFEQGRAARRGVEY